MITGNWPQETEKSVITLSGHTSMVITAFVFMVLMLIVTAPEAGPGQGPVMDHGPGYMQNNLTAPAAVRPPVPLIVWTVPALEPRVTIAGL